jgi:hypothetical protein
MRQTGMCGTGRPESREAVPPPDPGGGLLSHRIGYGRAAPTKVDSYQPAKGIFCTSIPVCGASMM